MTLPNAPAPQPVSVPLSAAGNPVAFAAALAAHAAALAAHRVGPAKVAAPVADPLVDFLVARIPDTGPVATRKPDTFQVRPYVIVDDTPKTPAQNQALSVLRETIPAKGT